MATHENYYDQKLDTTVIQIIHLVCCGISNPQEVINGSVHDLRSVLKHYKIGKFICPLTENLRGERYETNPNDGYRQAGTVPENRSYGFFDL
jgi:hypothetical protein